MKFIVIVFYIQVIWLRITGFWYTILNDFFSKSTKIFCIYREKMFAKCWYKKINFEKCYFKKICEECWYKKMYLKMLLWKEICEKGTICQKCFYNRKFFQKLCYNKKFFEKFCYEKNFFKYISIKK